MFDLFGRVSPVKARDLVFRGALVLVGLVALVGAAGFLLGWRDVTRIWPFTGYGMTPVFLASILAAIAAPVIWIGLSGEFAALRGGASNLLVTGGGIAGYGLSQSGGDPAGRVQLFAIIHLAIAVVALLLLVASQRAAWRDDRPTPVLVRIAFGIFGIGLVVVGTALVLRQDVFPWLLAARHVDRLWHHLHRRSGLFCLWAVASRVGQRAGTTRRLSRVRSGADCSLRAPVVRGAQPQPSGLSCGNCG